MDVGGVGFGGVRGGEVKTAKIMLIYLFVWLIWQLTIPIVFNKKMVKLHFLHN